LRGSIRTTDIARGGLGAALTLAPRRSVELATAGPSSDGVDDLARVLGIRLLVQAAAGAVIRRRWLLVAECGTELIHVGSMVAVGARSRPHRRAAVASAIVALMFAASDLRAARRSSSAS
jgi:hypothetical protein